METEKLYYRDAYLTEFTANVLSCEKTDKAWQVVLDRTAFYPEGGGQPADHGTLGTARVTDVHEKEGVIVHTCAAPVEPGPVTGRVDWARRFDHMQQHSGEHILSGILCADYRCDNVGFHMGADVVTIDYNTDISWQQALAAEAKANDVIWADRATEVTYPGREELERLQYRSKKELTGQVRIVTFPAADCCACCGTHVRRSGEVGLVKVLSVQKFREGVRMEILCGGRALHYLGAVYDQDRAVAQALSVKPEQTAAAVARLQSELQEAKFRAARLEEAHFADLAARYAGAGDVLLVQPPMSADSARRLADAVARSSGGLGAVFAGSDEEKYNYALVAADGRDISARVKAMNAALRGRGGGRNGFAQGSVAAAKAEIEAFFGEMR
ncbi:alanyl-tRNA editing protein [Dysosmobacter sp.]|uniref:alanyl-tRNA editing protein n=1 Tax=Dysosmobacter sp. TaxID=2591382 RepID=UPI002A8A9584|nr:alanyl-tRNA editing protein [Dysosmobacter sp.]MDY3282052.1 alanyl-tRNA editing protein [Dysosmobacter sp.]